MVSHGWRSPSYTGICLPLFLYSVIFSFYEERHFCAGEGVTLRSVAADFILAREDGDFIPCAVSVVGGTVVECVLYDDDGAEEGIRV